MKAVGQNLEKARRLTKEEVAGADVAMMFDGIWQKGWQ